MKYFIQKFRNLLFSEKFNGKQYGCGVLREKHDEREFQLGWNLFGYKPQHEVYGIETLEVKDQHYNTCAQEAITSCVEVLKQEVLSEQFQSTMLRAEGAVVQDGFSSLTENLKSIVKRGICQKQLLNEDDAKMSYAEYTKRYKITTEMLKNAELRKISGFASLVNRDARLKALDEGNLIYTAMDWYSGFNINGGFKSPWIIKVTSGWFVGGHAVFIRGYDLPRKVYIVQNSYSKEWGGYIDSQNKTWIGCFAVSMDYFDKNGHSSYKLINVDEDIDDLLVRYEGKDVKGKSSGIFRIEKGVKRAYPDKLTFYAFGGQFGPKKTYLDISETLFAKVTRGDDMNLTESPYWPLIQDRWPFIKVLAEPDNLKEVDNLITLFNNNGSMPLAKKFPMIGSSVDPDKVSLTIKGALIGLIPVIIFAAKSFGLDIGEGQVQSAVEAIVNLINAGLTFASTLMIVVGGMRKAVVWYKTRK